MTNETPFDITNDIFAEIDEWEEELRADATIVLLCIAGFMAIAFMAVMHWLPGQA